MNQTLDSRPVQIDAVLGAHGVDTSQYTFDYVAGWAARATTETTSITDIIIATGQRVIAAADRILSHTQPRQNPGDQVVDDSAMTVRPVSPIVPEQARWEQVQPARLRGQDAERAVVSAVPRHALGVPR